MYFPYASTRLYAAEREADGGDPILALARSPDGELLASLTASSLCVWSARQHRVVLGYYPRHQASLESDGSNVRLCWHPDSHTLAVSTSGSFVYLYQVQEASGGSAGRQQHLSAEDCARLLQGQFRVSISLTQKVQAAVQEGAATGAIAAGRTCFWLGVARGVLLAIEWTVQDPTPRKLHLHALESDTDERHVPAAVTAVCCSSALDLVVGLDGDGRVGYAFGAEQRCGSSHSTSGPVSTAQPLPLAGGERGAALAVSTEQRRLCVGCTSGALLVYHLREQPHGVGVSSEAQWTVAFERKLTLLPWGINPEESGSVVAIAWSDDGVGLASLWDHRASPAIWSLSGSCSILPPTQVAAAAAAAPGAADARSVSSARRAMPRAVAWAINGLALWTGLDVGLAAAGHSASSVDQGGAEGEGLLGETVLVQPCAVRGPCQSEASRRCFQTHDRAFMLMQHNTIETETSAGGSKAVSAVDTQFGWRELAVPSKYLAENWPIRHVSASADGTQLAVSGACGLTLLDLRTKRWRVFGDVSQERELSCVGVGWFRHIVIVYAIMETAPAEENIWGDSQRQADTQDDRPVVQLHLYPRKHLDRSSRLFAPASLPAPPQCMDVDEKTGVLASLCKDGSLVLHQLWLRQRGEMHSDAADTDPEAMELRAVTLLAQCRVDWAIAPGLGDIAIQKMRLAPAALVLPCILPAAAASGGTADAVEAATAARETRAKQLGAATAAPSLCLMLLRDGKLELCDASSGLRLLIGTDVADFWLTPASSLPFEDVTAVPLLWCSGGAGQLWVCRAGDLADDWAAAIATAGDSATALPCSKSLQVWISAQGGQDANEAWTIGLSEHYGVMLSVSAAHLGAGQQPELAHKAHELVINQSPVLHRLLESLLFNRGESEVGSRSAAAGACTAVCQRCVPAWPSLATSLEWLLHGALERVGTKIRPAAGDSREESVLSQALGVLRCFPQEYEGIIGRCARTMDPAFWRPLFQEQPYGAGQPLELFEACLRKHNPPQLRNAAHYLLILQTTLPELEEWAVYPPRLVDLALTEGDLILVKELLQFLRRVDAYANAAAAAAAAPADSHASAAPQTRSGAYGRLPPSDDTAAQLARNDDSSDMQAEDSGGGGGWLEFLGFVDPPAPAPAPAPQSRSMPEPEPEPEPELSVPSASDASGPASSPLQARVVPIIEAHAGRLLRELRLSELSRYSGMSASCSSFDLPAWLRAFHDGEPEAGAVDDFAASVSRFHDRIQSDKQRRPTHIQPTF